MKTSTRKFATSLLIAALAMPSAPAQAESFATAIALAGDRERVAAMLARPEVQAQLQAHGVDAGEASVRVAAGYAIFAVAVLTVSVVALAGYGVVKLMKKAAS